MVRGKCVERTGIEGETPVLENLVSLEWDPK